VVYYKYVLQEAFSRSSGLGLDAGCGKIGSIETNPSDIEMVGVDIDRRFVYSAKHKTSHFSDCVAASLQMLPFKSEVFNAVVLQDVLEHVETKGLVLQEVARVMKSKGKFIGSTTNLLNPLMLFDCLAPKWLLKPLVQKFAGEQYERHLRLTPRLLNDFLARLFAQWAIQLCGTPQFRPSKYSDKNHVPLFVKLWIWFDKLTNARLRTFKEMMIFQATK